LRIAQVVHWFLPGHRSGTEQHVHGLANCLAARHQVAVFSGEDDPIAPVEAEETYEGLQVRRVRSSPPAGASLADRALARFRNRAAEAAFAGFLHDFDPDIVHVHHLFKLSASFIRTAQRCGIPVVVTLHDYWFICDTAQLLYGGRTPCPGPHGGWACAACLRSELAPGWQRVLAPCAAPLYLYRTRFLRKALQRADAVIAPSQYVRTRMRQAGVRLPRCQVLPHGTDDSWLACYRPQPAQGKLRVGYLGTLAPAKGVDLLVDALLRLPPGRAELHIWGCGAPEYEGTLRARAADAAVTFHGPYARHDLGDVLGGLDLVVVPSVWPENAPLTVQEAHLARVPVLAAASGGLPEWVRHEVDGLLFPAGDVDALATALRRTLAEPALLAAWAAAISPPKTMGVYATEVEDIYRQLLAEAERKP
jgi:glycosyltransferase involved in cell wall biosynthesis